VHSISNAVGFGLIGYSIGKPEVTNKPITETMVLGKPKKRLSFYDRQAIHEVEIQMYKSHGHADTRTMESDMLNGVLASELLNRRCSICGRLRSESGE
jgi:hypothetical protein